MLIQRLKNLWYWSTLTPPRDAYFESDEGVKKIVHSSKLSPQLTESVIIPYKKRDPVKEIVGDESAIV